MVKKATDSKHRIFDERKRTFMLDFAMEDSRIRESLVKDLPAYNELLSLKATSFEEFALQHYENGQISCPYCNKHENVRFKSEGIYFCRSCNKSFTVNHNSISSGTKCDALKWMKVLTCLLNGFSINKTCEYCDITVTTYYKIRNRLFYAMQVLLADIKLYGVIEVDNTFIRCSYKGTDLRESEFEEDSIFFVPNFIPREARQRGGAYFKNEYNSNSVCIYTAIDDHGHVLTRFAGIGMTNYQTLKHYIPKQIYLLTVPKKDPFKFINTKEKKCNNSTSPGTQSIMVSDREKSIEKYAKHVGINLESHIYRKNGVQLKLKKEAHNIQRVNALHHRLKDFLHKHHYVSTKYLPGYLVLFEFIENTGASREAIGQLFYILSKPNFGKPSKFFTELYTMPNYLQEWLHSDHPLSKLPYNKILAFYLFYQFKNKDVASNTDITLNDIEDETGYTAPTIRKIYRDLKAAGYKDLILAHFKNVFPSEQSDQKKTSGKSPLPQRAPETINAVVLAIYDEYAPLRKLPASQRPRLQDFLEEKNRQYGTNYTRQNMYAKFKYIQEAGIRPPLDDLQKPEKLIRTEKAINILRDYENTINNHRENGEPIPDSFEICCVLSKKYSLAPSTIMGYLTFARGIRRENNKN